MPRVFGAFSHFEATRLHQHRERGAGRRKGTGGRPGARADLARSERALARRGRESVGALCTSKRPGCTNTVSPARRHAKRARAWCAGFARCAPARLLARVRDVALQATRQIKDDPQATSRRRSPESPRSPRPHRIRCRRTRGRRRDRGTAAPGPAERPEGGEPALHGGDRAAPRRTAVEPARRGDEARPADLAAGRGRAAARVRAGARGAALVRGADAARRSCTACWVASTARAGSAALPSSATSRSPRRRSDRCTERARATAASSR